LALIAPVLPCLLVLAPLAAALQPPAAAAAAANPYPLRVTIGALRPIAPQPGDTLVITGTFTNTSATTITGINDVLKLGAAPIQYRGEFDTDAADPSPEQAANDIGQVVTADPAELAPGASEPFRISVPTSALGLDSTWQVRSLGVSVTGTTSVAGFGVVGYVGTFLPWAPRSTVGTGYPIRVAWVWPLVDRPHRTTPTSWFDDALAAELGPTGRLTSLLAAGNNAEQQRPPDKKHSTVQNVPVTWALDPMLVNDVRAMTAGYQVTTPGGTTAGKGTAAAKAWLTALTGAVSKPDAGVLPLPYADPDIVALARNSAGSATTSIGLASESGRTVLQQVLHLSALPHIAWPVGGLADQRSLNALQAIGDTSVVLSGDAVPPLSPPPETPSAHTTIPTSQGDAVDALLTDPQLSADVDGGPDYPGGARLSLQRYLAETLIIQEQGPNDVRDVVVAPNRRWAPTPGYAAALLADTGKVPWITPVSLNAVAASPVDTSVQRGPLTYRARHNELSSAYLNAVAALRADVATFAAILPQGNADIRTYTAAEQQAVSASWRTDRALASTELSALRNKVLAQMRQVRISSKGGTFVTLTSHGGSVPVTIANDLSTPVHVTLQLLRNQRLTFSKQGRVTVDIPPKQQTQVELHATAKTSGVFPLKVQLETANGKAYGPKVQLFVRSTVYGTITLVITGAATAALMVAVAIRLTRRALAARRQQAGAARA
jgi:hypothetical protein